MVSESIPGNPEHIFNVSGALDAVSKAFSLIVRRINDGPFDVPPVPGSRACNHQIIIPNSRMGSVIGRGESKIKEIQEAIGARLNGSEGMLPGSTAKRLLSISGLADAIRYPLCGQHIDRNRTSQHIKLQLVLPPSSNSRSGGGGSGGPPGAM